MKAPYYESRFVRANHPDRAQALWLRETLLLTGSGAASADVWVMAFDPDGHGNIAVKQPYPVQDAEFGSNPWTVRIGDTFLDDGRAHGSLVGARTAAWELSITGGGEPVKLLPDRQYSTRFPSAKTSVRSPLARFDGQLSVDGLRFELDRWAGSVNHNWGRRHTPAYAFGQVCGFDGAASSSLEIVTARAGVGPVALSPVTLLVFRHDGREFAVRTVLAARRTSGAYEPFHWSFSARSDDVVLDGEISCGRDDVIGLNYTDTNGKSKYCYNSAVANCRIWLSGSRFSATRLTATRRAMFEILSDARQGRIPLLA
ncbi:MAG: hypothetical protein WAM92_06775 [Mycobacterium sp.]